MSEKELVVMAKAGNAKAFAQLYGIYKKKLYSYAFQNIILLLHLCNERADQTAGYR